MVPCRNPHTCFQFELQGEIVPKARPRLSRNGHAYTQPNYRTWKDAAILSLRQQAIHQGITTPIDRAAVTIALMGKHPRRGDCDNLAGSILDSLVQSGILANDNLTVVDRLSIALDYSKRSPVSTIILELPH